MNQEPYFRDHGYDIILTQTEYNKSDRSILADSLLLAKVLLKSTDGRALSAEEISKINQRLEKEGKKQRIAKGGQSTLFVMFFQMPSLSYQEVIIKIYQPDKLSLPALITHYVAVLEFKKLFQDLPIPVILQNNSERTFLVRCADILGLGLLKEDNTPLFTVLLQEKSRGPSIEKAGEFAPRNMSSITKTIARHGFIIDPYGRNWRIGAGILDASDSFVTTLEYIDLLLLNVTDEQREMIRKVMGLFNST
ncbi:MAG: hypothetical protein ACE5OZ_23955 [Candidatus Heimdallarchaeota archaeon]